MTAKRSRRAFHTACKKTKCDFSRCRARDTALRDPFSLRPAMAPLALILHCVLIVYQSAPLIYSRMNFHTLSQHSAQIFFNLAQFICLYVFL